MQFFSTRPYVFAVLAATLCMAPTRVTAESAAEAGVADKAPASHLPEGYGGKPYEDDRYTGGAQAVPGAVYCAYFDLGGEGVAYHDNTEQNHGSGGLNPLDGDYYNEFRHRDGMDTSYTKDGIDDNEFSAVKPPIKQLYVGWTEPGEWFNMTVAVAEDGVYSADLLYTSNRGGTIAFDVNSKPAGEPVEIKTTNDPDDPVDWRQWHHWNRQPVGEFKLAQGLNLITLHITTEGNFNFATLDFKPRPAE